MNHESAVRHLPEDVWEGEDYTYIHVAIVFADLVNSVMISSTLPPPDYNRLVNAFQQVMIELVDLLKTEDQHLVEYRIIGDSLALFFYDPEEVWRNWKLDGPEQKADSNREQIIDKCREVKRGIAYAALKAAIKLKNAWLVQPTNMARVTDRQEPLELGIGVHFGRAYLTNRPDGERRIEGHTINLAKRIESFSRYGKYSQIMLSEDACKLIRSSIIGRTQLRQRVFFHEHEVALELLKGITRPQRVYELKFFSRIGIHISDQALRQYDAIFALSDNVWAYYQLFEHYAYIQRDWEKVFEIAQRVYLAYPNDEKVLLDLSRYYLHQGSLHQAKDFALRALKINESFDLVLEHLAVISSIEGDINQQIEYSSRAASLSPGSAVNHMNLGLALCEAGRCKEGEHHMLRALSMFPGYTEREETLAILSKLKEEGKLSENVVSRLAL